MILFLDTSQKEKIIIAVYARNVFKKRNLVKIKNHHSEELLKNIDAFLKIHSLKARSLSGIAVVSGPGGFSSLRIGITCANTLAWALEIPVFGVAMAEFDSNEKEFRNFLFKKLKKARRGIFVVPLYGKEPNITFPH